MDFAVNSSENYPDNNQADNNNNSSSSAGASTRSSARVKAARERLQSTSSQTLKTNQKKKEVAVTSRGITINEPTDRKGKKRAIPEPDSADEREEQQILKRSKAPVTRATRSTTAKMAKKSRAQSKGKAMELTSSTKGKESMIVGMGDDVDMGDDGVNDRDLEREMDLDAAEAEREGHENGGGDEDDEDDEDEDNEDSERNAAAVAALAAARAGGDTDPRTLFSLLSASMGLPAGASDFPAHILSSLGGLGMGLGGAGSGARLSSLLTSIQRPSISENADAAMEMDDPTTRLIALQELSEILSMSNEETLGSGLDTEALVRALIRILGGTGAPTSGGNDSDDSTPNSPASPDPPVAQPPVELPLPPDMPEAQLLASRCLANLMEAVPGSAHTIVYHGGIKVLCSKLEVIEDIEVAEQTLSTLQKISEEYPSALLRKNGLSALLNMLDFFPTPVQRTALHATANVLRNCPSDPETIAMIQSVFPIIKGVIEGSSDARMVEWAAMSVVKVIDSWGKGYGGGSGGSPSAGVEALAELMDASLIRAISVLLLPSSTTTAAPAASGTQVHIGSRPLLASTTYTSFLRSLATAARASPKITLRLLEADIVGVLYMLLTGVLPPSGELDDAMGQNPQGLGGSVGDMKVMDNLAHRPKDQVEEALSLVSELMPPLPKDGVFDPKSYTEKALAKMIKVQKQQHKEKREKIKAMSSKPIAEDAPPPTINVEAAAVEQRDKSPGSEEPPDMPMLSDASGAENATPAPNVASSSKGDEKNKSVASRIELLQSKPLIVERFIQLMVPVLVDVYSASVLTNVRIRSMSGILKAVAFLDGRALSATLQSVPVASFAASIISSTDHHTLVISALQLVELLLVKSAATYRMGFRREGLLHEIDVVAERKLKSAIAKEAAEAEATKGKERMKREEEEREIKKEEDEREIAATSLDASTSPGPVPPPKVEEDAEAISVSVTPLNGIADVVSAPTPSRRAVASAATVDPQDVIIMRSRVLRFKYLIGKAEAEEDVLLGRLRILCNVILDEGANSDSLQEAVEQIAAVLAGDVDSISSFELKQSGLIDAMLSFITAEGGYKVPLIQRQQILTAGLGKTPGSLSLLVKRLQEILTRNETFDVRTVSPGYDDSKHRSASMLARSMRLRLVAEENSDLPRGATNMTVSIQAIATFQALNDYLRPRLSGALPTLGGSTASRLNAMLALAESKAQAHGLFGTPPGGAKVSAGDSNSANTSTPGASGSSASQVVRRRSQRLSTKASKEVISAPKPAETEQSAQETSAPVASGSRLDDPLIEPEVEAEIVDEDDDEDLPDKTISVSLTDDGSKIEAKTPQGTRVATPNPLREKPSSSSAAAARGSYAAALKSKPTDWHLEFCIDEHKIPLDATIYGAFYQHELRKSAGTAIHPSSIWSGLYTVKFKKVDGPPQTTELRTAADGPTVMSNSSCLPEDQLCSRILRLLRVLHKLNAQTADHRSREIRESSLPTSAFINNKLTAKLVRQLEETMIVASSCLPDWALDLPQHYPLLFPFSTRYSFLQSTSFGYARLILKWQSQQERGSENSRRDEGFGYLGRLQRQKVRISRKHILESAVKVFELYGSSSSVLEVEYFEEVGTGLGPTLEFYSLVSKELARRDLKLWRDADSTLDGQFVFHPQGLFPAPLNIGDASESRTKRLNLFQMAGQFVAKALLDSRIIDISFNRVFLRLVLGDTVPLTLETLMMVDPAMANSLIKVRGWKDQADPQAYLESLSLDFTIPGYTVELIPDGQNVSVVPDNVEQYLEEALNALLGKGVEEQIQQFRNGFSKVFSILDMGMFTAEELAMLFGNGDEDWSLETITDAIKADHGFTIDSQPIRHLLAIMSQYSPMERRQFLQFITGSPKLPIGGFRGLNPPFTVVRKPHEAPLSADDYLPSVMTCVNYLKLPDYSSHRVMKERLLLAAKEGIHSGFHLS